MELTTLAQNTNNGLPIGIIAVIYLAIIAVVIAGMWKMFEKAGQPGWAAIIPFYNTYILCKIVGRPGWWLILLLIPYINFVFWIIIMLDLAKSFARGVGFALGLIFLSPIFFCILGFGSSQYQGPARA
ncbi:MAG: signal peptidase I [Planctomycetota bacterium]|nr:MAG: signal peptidase I [Planctomycetota bacterium]